MSRPGEEVDGGAWGEGGRQVNSGAAGEGKWEKCCIHYYTHSAHHTISNVMPVCARVRVGVLTRYIFRKYTRKKLCQTFAGPESLG